MFYAFFCYLLQFGYYILQFYFVFLVLQVKYEDKAIFHFFFRLLITLFVIALLGCRCVIISLPGAIHLCSSISLSFSPHAFNCLRYDLELFHSYSFYSPFFFLLISFQAPHSEIEKNLLLHMPFDIRLIGMSCEPRKIQIALSHFCFYALYHCPISLINKDFNI